MAAGHAACCMPEGYEQNQILQEIAVASATADI